MDKSSKTQILNVFLIVALLGLTPLLSTSLRSTYLYFIFNLLIIALGADAGLLSFFSKSVEEKKPAVPAKTTIVDTLDIAPTGKEDKTASNANGMVSPELECDRKKVKPSVGKCSSEKVVGAVKVRTVQKSPSTPSLFFIGGGAENDSVGEDPIAEEDDWYDEEEDHVGVPSEQELFHKSENFIGNFYKQLKMQREDSWKKIHGLYQKAF